MTVNTNGDGGYLSVIQSNGVYAIFYRSTGSNSIVYVTCPISNCVWSSETAVPTAGNADVSVWSSGSKVYYVSSSNSRTDSNFYFGTGAMSSQGTISWNPEQSVSTGFSFVLVGKGALDSFGNVWVTVGSIDGSNVAHFQVFSYSGSWADSLTLNAQSSGGFPNDFFIGFPVALTSGKVVVVYQESHGNAHYVNAHIRTCSGLGCSWSAAYDTTAIQSAQTTATSIGDVVQMCAYNSGGNGDVDYVTFAYGSPSWNIRVISSGLPTVSGGYNCAITTDGTRIDVLFSNEGPGTYYTFSTNQGSTWSSLAQIDSFGSTSSQRQTVPPTYSGSFPVVWYCKDYPTATTRFATLP